MEKRTNDIILKPFKGGYVTCNECRKKFEDDFNKLQIIKRGGMCKNCYLKKFNNET